jgi:hypothetical protein
MNIPELVDELYEAFAAGIGEPLGERARDLPRALRLAGREHCPWSEVFSHEVTLGAPALFAETMDLPPQVVRDGVLAHALAVIDAFGTDRIEDEQVLASPELVEVLGRARRERDRAITRVLGGPPSPECDYAAADERSARAIRTERTFLLSERPVQLDAYEQESLGKQAPGMVASLALAHAAGWDDLKRRVLTRTLESVWIGLQMYDDVVDWEDDLARGGSWAVCLMKGARRAFVSHEPSTEGARLRAQVLASGMLLAMLSRAVHHMDEARRGADSLGAHRLAAWAATRQERFETLCAAEARSAGYTVRAHALSAWAGEVLA